MTYRYLENVMTQYTRGSELRIDSTVRRFGTDIMNL